MVSRHFPRPDSTVLSLLAILALALAVRLTWVAVADTIPIADQTWYHAVTANLVEGRGFTARFERGDFGIMNGEATAFWPPGYSFLLVVPYWLFGAQLATAQVVNAVLGALTVLPTYALGRAAFDRRVGLMAATIMALFPSHVFWTSTLFADVPFTFVFTVALWYLVAHARRPSARQLMTFALLVAAATYVRGQGLLLLPTALVLWWLDRGMGSALRGTAVVGIAIIALILPWTIRNTLTFGEFVPLSTNVGYNLRIGHSEAATRDVWTAPEDLWRETPGLSFSERELLFNRLGAKRALDFALHHPLDELKLIPKKVVSLIEADSDSVGWAASLGRTPIGPQALERGLWRLVETYYYLVLPLALIGAAVSFRASAVTKAFVALALMWMGFHVVFFAEPRFHVPLLPVLSVFAACVLAEILAIYILPRTGDGRPRQQPDVTPSP